MTKTKKYSFSKVEKLKSRKQIDLVFRSGKSFFAAPVKCFYLVQKLRSPEDGEKGSAKGEAAKKQITKCEVQNSGVGDSEGLMVKAGFSVSKKLFKKAVERNRVKRLMREAYRLHKHRLLEQVNAKELALEVFFVFTDKVLPDYRVVEDKIKYCLRRLGRILEEKV